MSKTRAAPPPPKRKPAARCRWATWRRAWRCPRKGTAHRICTPLPAGGFLARDVDERRFIVGPALRQLAFDTLNHGVLLYLDRVEAQWPPRLTLDADSFVPLHCTASGKLFLAQMRRLM